MKKIFFVVALCSIFFVNFEPINAQNNTLDPGDEPCEIINGQWSIRYWLFLCNGYGTLNCRPATC